MIKTSVDKNHELPRWEIPAVETADGSNIAIPAKEKLDLIEKSEKLEIEINSSDIEE